MIYTANSLQDTNNLAKQLLEGAMSLNSQGALKIGLFGDLGSGKTTFVQFFGKHLGVEDTINSPTFVLMRSYPITEKSSPWNNMIHIDAYRLESKEELNHLDWERIIDIQKNIIFVEWPNQVLLPENFFDLQIKVSHSDQPGQRVFEVNFR